MQWKVGDRVLANWSHDLFWYPAVIRELEGERIYVKFDDGDKEWTSSAGLMKLDVETGDRVYCRWQDGTLYYPGRVTQKENEKIYVEYDDGDQEWTTISHVRVTR